MKNETEKIVLANGTRILLEPDSRARSCAMGVWAASGSAYEDSAAAGTSHFIEHMLFRGTAKRSSREIAEQMDQIGAYLNAFTAKEYTCFYSRALTEHAAQAFDILGDMLTSPAMKREDIELEKGVIGEEISMYEDSPEDLCVDKLYDAVWGSERMGGNILGTAQTVADMTRERLCAHMEEFYAPERLVISFCGNFDREGILEQCKSFFGQGENTANPFVPARAQYRRSVTAVKKNFEQNQLIIAFPGVSHSAEWREAAQLMSSILGGASSSRLFQRIRDELGLVYSIDTANASFVNEGLFFVSMGVSPKSEEKAVKQTMEIMRRFAGEVTEKELSRAKEQAVAGLVMGNESVSARVSYNGMNELLFGEIDDEAVLTARLRAVTLDDVRAAAERILDFGNISLCAVGNVKSESYYKKLIDF